MAVIQIPTNYYDAPKGGDALGGALSQILGIVLGKYLGEKLTPTDTALKNIKQMEEVMPLAQVATSKQGGPSYAQIFGALGTPQVANPATSGVANILRGMAPGYQGTYGGPVPTAAPMAAPVTPMDIPGTIASIMGPNAPENPLFKLFGPLGINQARDLSPLSAALKPDASSVKITQEMMNTVPEIAKMGWQVGSSIDTPFLKAVYDRSLAQQKIDNARKAFEKQLAGKTFDEVMSMMDFVRKSKGDYMTKGGGFLNAITGQTDPQADIFDANIQQAWDKLLELRPLGSKTPPLVPVPTGAAAITNPSPNKGGEKKKVLTAPPMNSDGTPVYK